MQQRVIRSQVSLFALTGALAACGAARREADAQRVDPTAPPERADADGGGLRPASPSYAAVVLPERDVTSDDGYGMEKDEVLFAVRADPRGGVVLLFREPPGVPSPDAARFHLRYVTRDGDASRASASFAGPGVLGNTSFDVHPSGEITACGADATGTKAGAGPAQALSVTRFDRDGRVLRSARAGEAGRACEVIADGEDALVFSGAGTPGSAVRVSASGGVLRLDEPVAPTMLDVDIPSSLPMWARSATRTVWTASGDEIDLATGRALRSAGRMESLVALTRNDDGKVYRVGVPGGVVVVDELPSSGGPKVLFETVAGRLLPLSPARGATTAFLATPEGWTMPDGSYYTDTEGLLFLHGDTIGGPVQRLVFPGAMHLEAALATSDRQLYVVGWLQASSNLGTIALTHPGGATAHVFVARFQDWSSLVAAHDVR